MTANREFWRGRTRRLPCNLWAAGVLLLIMAAALTVSAWQVYQQRREYVAPHPDAPLPKGERSRLHSMGL